MLETFLFVGLPYLALFAMIVGSIYRYRFNRFSFSALSSQMLESQKLLWGSVPFHLGIAVIVTGHLIPFLFPGLWHSLTSNQTFLITVEILGLCAAFLCAFGLCVLLIRRIQTVRLQYVTTVMDLTVVGLLLLQVLIGIALSSSYRWGASWSTGTTTPYLWSVLTLHPDISYIVDMPALIKVHLVAAYVLFLLVPFSRLVHVFSLPIEYLFRLPQKVVWTNIRRIGVMAVHEQASQDRRLLLKGLLGTAGALSLLSLGVFDKIFLFFRGPRMDASEELALLQKRLKRLEATARERNLQLERMQQSHIFVARLSDLAEKQGHYFIDYHMRPALAFKDTNGMPILISAKCTHLGCTISSDVDAQGRILCPCHISYFSLKTGQPEPNSPAKTPLPILGWVIMDNHRKIVAQCPPYGKPEGNLDPGLLSTCSIYIAKAFEEPVS